MAELTPLPFATLARGMLRELDRKDSIFGLPRRKFFLGSPGHDLSVDFHGQRAASPFGPAAGPQSQMAQNLVLSWLVGARILELKTVQVDDDLRIPRPCIDMQTVGYNVEWSQELKVSQSLREYVKGAMLIEILKDSGRIELAPGFGDTLHDMSVGYDLAGLRSPKVQGFLEGMGDAASLVQELRRELPAELRMFRDLDYPTRISNTLTLSTFHGCPPREIEGMIDHLLRNHGLHCIVKLNPMLLGPEETRRILHEQLGYTDIHVPDSAFERDTTWDQMVEFVGRLGETARSLGLGFGVKFTNTLIVENRRAFFPAECREMYLSGRPLHVLAMHLVQRFRRTFRDRYPISFSAGIERRNFPDAVALGLVPVTTCSDLLRPGGYGRAQGYFRELLRRMDEVSATTIGEFVLHGSSGEKDLASARLANTDAYLKRLDEDPRYQASQNRRLPRKIGSQLELFDCITCDKCLPVCPNAANFILELPPASIQRRRLVRHGEGWHLELQGVLELTEKHQIASFADFCNDCGNCDVFCPEDGGPYLVKPRFFGSLASWRAADTLDGFAFETTEQERTLHARVTGDEFSLTKGPAGTRFQSASAEVDLTTPAEPRVVRGSGAPAIDLTWAAILERMWQAVLDPDAPNFVNGG